MFAFLTDSHQSVYIFGILLLAFAAGIYAVCYAKKSKGDTYLCLNDENLTFISNNGDEQVIEWDDIYHINEFHMQPKLELRDSGGACLLSVRLTPLNILEIVNTIIRKAGSLRSRHSTTTHFTIRKGNFTSYVFLILLFAASFLLLDIHADKIYEWAAGAIVILALILIMLKLMFKEITKFHIGRDEIVLFRLFSRQQIPFESIEDLKMDFKLQNGLRALIRIFLRNGTAYELNFIKEGIIPAFIALTNAHGRFKYPDIEST